MKNEKLCVTCRSCQVNEHRGSHECRRNPPTTLPTQRTNPLNREMEMGVMSVYPPIDPMFPACDDYVSKLK